MSIKYPKQSALALIREHCEWRDTEQDQTAHPGFNFLIRLRTKIAEIGATGNTNPTVLIDREMKARMVTDSLHDHYQPIWDAWRIVSKTSQSQSWKDYQILAIKFLDSWIVYFA